MISFQIVICKKSLFSQYRESHKDQEEVQTTMNKYELALVVNAKIEDDARTEAVDKVKA